MTREERLAAGKLIVAVDGPSGAGKSTVTRMLADRLGYLYIDTGAMYRAVALAVKRAGVDPEDDAALAALCGGLSVDLLRDNGSCRVFLNGEEVTAEIRTPEISLLTSQISARKPVRAMLLTCQRKLGAVGGVILEGRDIGTVVFPEADAKFFLSATAEERGRRRYLELKANGGDVALEQTVAEVVQRDEQDSRREHAPLKQAEDAIPIDSTGLAIDQVVARMEALVRGKMQGRRKK